MTRESKLISVRNDDERKMMGIIKDNFLDAHPEFKGMVVTRAFMFSKLVEYALGRKI